MKIVFTGGHHTSSLVVAKALQEKGQEIVWFGHKKTMWKEPSLSLEYEDVKAIGIPFVEIKAGKLYREFNLLKILRIPYGFINAFFQLLRVRPDLIVSFGGYLALPTVICGWLLKIPSVTHEQTRSFGLSNKLISPIVKKIFLTWQSSKKYFPKDKAVVTGLPLREEILKAEKQTQEDSRPLIYITGGKQGSHLLNQAVVEILPQLLEKYTLYHQSGKIIKTGDLAFLQKKRNSLSGKLRKHYHLSSFFTTKEVAKIFSLADLVITRSGAHIVYELAYLGIPAIFIPIPWTFEKEQEKNADFFSRNKAGLVLKQEELTPKILLKMTKEVLNHKSFNKNAQLLKSKLKKEAAFLIIEKIEEVLNAQKKT